MKVGMYVPTKYPLQSSQMGLKMAEDMEADSIWALDHLLGAWHPALWREMPFGKTGADPDAYLDPFCVAAVLGGQTDLPLGIGVTDSVRRRSPDVARSALTLQHLCRGGFNLGVGAGEAQSLLPFGYRFDHPVSVFELFLRELRSLLDTGSMPEHPFARIGLPLESDRGRPRIWVGGHGPRMLRLTGQFADGWLPAWPMTADVYGERCRRVAEHADAAGRPAPEPGLVLFVVLGDGRERVARMFDDEPLAKLWALMAPADVWQRHGLSHPLGNTSGGFIDAVAHMQEPDALRGVARETPFSVVEEMLFVGTENEIAERLAEYGSNGCRHIVIGNLSGIVGGLEEMQKQAPRLMDLRRLLGKA